MVVLVEPAAAQSAGLAFWTGGDRPWVDRLFRQSGLMREKWGEVRYADSSTHGEKTVERAVAGVSEYYDPDVASDSGGVIDSKDTGRHAPGDAHLAEKNRLLTERVADLEATLEPKEARIAELEVKLERVDN